MNLADLQKEAHAIAKDHGWWDEERTFGDLIALVHSELSEALEAYRMYGLEKFYSYEGLGRKKLEGVASELADVVIRVADMAEHYGARLSVPPSFPHLYTFGEWINSCPLLRGSGGT